MRTCGSLEGLLMLMLMLRVAGHAVQVLALPRDERGRIKRGRNGRMVRCMFLGRGRRRPRACAWRAGTWLLNVLPRQ